jgi:hypothetical protein
MTHQPADAPGLCARAKDRGNGKRTITLSRPTRAERSPAALARFDRRISLSAADTSGECRQLPDWGALSIVR